MAKTGTRGEVMLECLDLWRGSFSQRFDAAIGKVLYISNYLMPSRRALRKEAIANALHVAANQKAPRHGS
jgi:hypothetical protein